MTPSFDVIWLILCAILVSTMQAGFCSLESGLVRAKNSINVAIKNLVDFCIACFIFSLFGFNLMFGDSLWGLIGTYLPATSTWTDYDYAYFLFQLT
ncbi:MAG: ammonium transporter, partial [Halothece sp. Uz-M2-17]|nr:ammonium transporter [Halothece sp. Uz-M2-17]